MIEHDMRALTAKLIAAESLPLLQTMIDAARAAMGVVIHGDHAEDRARELARLDFVLDSAPWPHPPVAGHTVVEVTLAGVVRRLPGDAS